VNPLVTAPLRQLSYNHHIYSNSSLF